MSDGTVGSRCGADARRVSRALPLGVLCCRRNPLSARVGVSTWQTTHASRTRLSGHSVLSAVGAYAGAFRNSRCPKSSAYHRTCSHRVFGRTAVVLSPVYHSIGSNISRSSSSSSSTGGGNIVLTTTRGTVNIAHCPTRNGFIEPRRVRYNRLIISTLFRTRITRTFVLSPPTSFSFTSFYSLDRHWPEFVVLLEGPDKVADEKEKCSRCCGWPVGRGKSL